MFRKKHIRTARSAGRDRRRHIILAAAAIIILVFGAPFFRNWRQGTLNGGQEAVEPFRIAGNLYYVGANDVTSFLIVSPQGHVLIDGGYPGTARLIRASIAKLGFNIRDVKVLLNSHAHYDHAGGLAELQEASGAKLWISESEAEMVTSGGDHASHGPARILNWSGITKYTAPRVDRRFRDGDRVQLGPIGLTANVTPGHSPGCTSWSFQVQDRGRALNVVEVCSLSPPITMEVFTSAGKQAIKERFDRSFTRLRALPVDIFLTPHGRDFGRWRKFDASRRSADPVAPFIDRKGYLNYIDAADRTLRAEVY